MFTCLAKDVKQAVILIVGVSIMFVLQKPPREWSEVEFDKVYISYF